MWKILAELYRVSEPPLDLNAFLDGIENHGKKCPKKWFLKHKITESAYESVIDKMRKKYKVTEREWRRMQWSLFNYAPTFRDDV